MNTFKDHKDAILATRALIKSTKATAGPEHKNTAISMIFQARQLQHEQVSLAKKEYPGFNWVSLI